MIFAKIECAIFVLGLAAASCFGQSAATPAVTMTVRASDVLSDVSSGRIGINVNYLADRSSLFAPGAQPLQAALKNLDVHYLRYPGGEKSQSYLWSVPPFDAPRPSLARTGPKEFWASQQTFTRPDHKTLIDPMDFDEFMKLCHQVGCEPNIVVNHNSYLAPRSGEDGTAPTRDQLIQTAAAWVHYSNAVKHYGVRYWEIGNETYLKSYNGPRQEPSEYGKDVRDFAMAMKREDSSIKVGISGDNYEYYRDVLKVAADETDFIVVHTYPCCASYEAYQRTPRFDGAADAARKALAELPASKRAHISLALTEVNALDFLPGHKDVNDLGHAMLLFEILAQYLAFDPDVEFEEVWNTRWIENNETGKPPSIFDVLDNKNELNATGVAMSLLTHGLLKTMVRVDVSAADGMVTGYATSDGRKHLRVFVVNRDLQQRLLALEIGAHASAAQASATILDGRGPTDLKPAIHDGPMVQCKKGHAELTLPPSSITEISF